MWKPSSAPGPGRQAVRMQTKMQPLKRIQKQRRCQGPGPTDCAPTAASICGPRPTTTDDTDRPVLRSEAAHALCFPTPGPSQRPAAQAAKLHLGCWGAA
jgi:hypothetical protein